LTERLGGFAAKKLIFIFAATVGATQAAEQQHTDAHGDEHREERSDRE
jgi:hypothetical protein